MAAAAVPATAASECSREMNGDMGVRSAPLFTAAGAAAVGAAAGVVAAWPTESSVAAAAAAVCLRRGALQHWPQPSALLSGFRRHSTPKVARVSSAADRQVDRKAASQRAQTHMHTCAARAELVGGVV